MSTARVDFTRGAAERIARVVRLVEQGERDQAGPRYGRAEDSPAGKVFRVCTFTGAWSINTSKTVTFANQTATPNTASVLNSLIALPDAGSRKCVIGKEGTAWHLINWQWNTAVVATAATVSGTAVNFIGFPGGVVGTSTQNAFSLSLVSATAVDNVTLSSNALGFSRKTLRVLSTADASSVTIAVSSCVTSQASATQLSFFN